MSIPVVSLSCPSCVRSEEIRTLCSPSFDSIVSLCFWICLFLCPCLISFSSLPTHPFNTLFKQMSTLKCQLFFPSDVKCRMYCWLHFLLSHLSLQEYLLFLPCYFYHNFLSLLLSLSFGLSCHFPVLCPPLSILVLLSAVLMKGMTDVGVSGEMGPVIYFPVFCSACLGPESPRPQTTFPRELMFHAETAHVYESCTYA